MAAVVGSLLAKLSVDKSGLTSGLHAAGVDVTAFENKTNRQFSALDRNTKSRFASMGRSVAGLAAGFGIGLAGGITAALAPMALFQKAIHDIGDLADLQRAADRLGLAASSLQALRFGAVKAGVDIDQMIDGLGDFAGKVAEAASGAGPLAQIFKANGIELKNQDGTLRSTRDVLGDFANLIQNAQTPAEQLYLAQQAFSDEAAKMVPLFKNGADGITKLELSARQAGAVVDDELVKRAETLDTRFDSMWEVFSARSKSALLTAIEGMDSLIAKMNEYEKGANAAALGKLAGSLVPPPGGTITAPTQGRVTGLDARMAGEPVQADAKLVELLRARFGPGSGKATIIPPSNSGGGGGGSKSLKESVDYAEKLIENLEREKSLVGASELEIEKSNALWRAGTDATDKQKDKIGELITEIYNATEAHKKQEEAIREVSDAGRDFTSTFIDDLIQGKSATEALGDALGQLAKRLENLALDAIFGTGNSSSGGALLGTIGKFECQHL